jgi:ketosteroid isomerase-like protein
MTEPSKTTELVTEIFRRITAREHFDGLLTEDMHFEGAFDPIVIKGNVAVSVLYTDLLRSLLDPLELRMTSIYVDPNADVVFVEYRSHGTNIVKDEAYENTYAGLLHFIGDKLNFWREYGNPIPWLETAGDDIAKIIEQLPVGAVIPKSVWKTV